MNNLRISKYWEDNNLLEIKVSAESEFVKIHQLCYVQDAYLKGIGEKIIAYSLDYNEGCYVEFGQKEGNFTPAFSLDFLKADAFGHVKIELDMEIADNPDRAHRCSFYINSEIGLIEQFGKNLIRLSENKQDEVLLNN
ncbi:hypothetical protein L0903_001102 [Listeria innocua]|uniref:hypothetical protein n=1 Tax=Listeria innocua TaxID=1642 RepID=UPI001628CB9C|nr:hypothetical protein [Listeria innocua]EIS4901707.1 hypothetical protein [Listeria innocua]EIS4928203.1 hypothetical protein [Listeria innocua]EIS4932688.1 hypothetical protein [Listeria innocua]EIS4939890.1 hypothetical protein [Listeria innocua]EIS4942791.1 hypothetical protein [Listeria innocua]